MEAPTTPGLVARANGHLQRRPIPLLISTTLISTFIGCGCLNINRQTLPFSTYFVYTNNKGRDEYAKKTFKAKISDEVNGMKRKRRDHVFALFCIITRANECPMRKANLQQLQHNESANTLLRIVAFFFVRLGR